MARQRFVQQVDQFERGQIRYRVATTAGISLRMGRRLSEHFAAERDVFDHWVMTHLPTGRMVPGATRKRLSEVAALAAALEPLTDWSKARIKADAVLTAQMRAVGVRLLERVG